MSTPDFLKRWERIEAIPEGFTPHTDDSSPTGYPPGVTDDVRVDVVMGNRAVNLDAGEQFDHLVLWTDQHPQTFGWSITAIPSSTIPGMTTTIECPVLAYRIRKEQT